MPDLEIKIAAWRRQMAAGGFKTPAVLDELESHLREDVQRQVQSGTSTEKAFQTAVRRLGPSGVLADEFSKVGATNKIVARIKYFFLSLSGVQNFTLATNMNTSAHGNREPAWATYLKSGAFAAPAAMLWLLVAAYVFPLLNQLVTKSGVKLPNTLRLEMDLVPLLKQYTLLIVGGVVFTLALLEWRSQKWPRYRRVAFGIGAFLLNSAVLVAITFMVILALLAAPGLLQHAR